MPVNYREKFARKAKIVGSPPRPLEARKKYNISNMYGANMEWRYYDYNPSSNNSLLEQQQQPAQFFMPQPTYGYLPALPASPFQTHFDPLAASSAENSYCCLTPHLLKQSQDLAQIQAQAQVRAQAQAQAQAHAHAHAQAQAQAHAQAQAEAQSQTKAQALVQAHAQALAMAQQRSWSTYPTPQNYSYWYGSGSSIGAGARQGEEQRQQQPVLSPLGSSCLSRIDSVSSFRHVSGARRRNSQLDMAEYRRNAARRRSGRDVGNSTAAAEQPKKVRVVEASQTKERAQEQERVEEQKQTEEQKRELEQKQAKERELERAKELAQKQAKERAEQLAKEQELMQEQQLELKLKSKQEQELKQDLERVQLEEKQLKLEKEQRQWKQLQFQSKALDMMAPKTIETNTADSFFNKINQLKSSIALTSKDQDPPATCPPKCAPSIPHKKVNFWKRLFGKLQYPTSQKSMATFKEFQEREAKELKEFRHRQMWNILNQDGNQATQSGIDKNRDKSQ